VRSEGARPKTQRLRHLAAIIILEGVVQCGHPTWAKVAERCKRFSNSALAAVPKRTPLAKTFSRKCTVGCRPFQIMVLAHSSTLSTVDNNGPFQCRSGRPSANLTLVKTRPCLRGGPPDRPISVNERRLSPSLNSSPGGNPGAATPKNYPKSFRELARRFATEEVCCQYLFELRWPEGFHCPGCHGTQAWRTGRGLWLCGTCHPAR
jgi:Transposase zinc-ribbon domain